MYGWNSGEMLQCDNILGKHKGGKDGISCNLAKTNSAN